MKSSNILFSSIHFLVVFFILISGSFILVLPYASNFRVLLIDSLINNHPMYRVVGYFFIASSSLLFLGLYKINCRSFLQIEMNYGKCGVEKKLIQKRVEEYWQGLFPNVIPHVDVVVKSKKKLEFILNLPEKKDKSFFSSVEKDLANFLSNEFGYKKSFTLTLFENE